MTHDDALEADAHFANLLISHVTEGLDPAEIRDLEHHLADHEEFDPDEFLEAATLLDLAFASGAEAEPEPIPDRVRNAVLAQARSRRFTPASPTRLPRPQSPRPPEVSRTGWWVAAAAVVLMSVTLVTVWAPDLPPAAQRERMMARAGSVQWTWNPPTSEQFASVRGDVVWSGETQSGFLRFENLPALDPASEQYQLWIVDDATRRTHPVDGGLFDAPRGRGTVVVPFTAKLPVFSATAFAITVEPRGGVVVSDGPLEIVAAGS